MTQSPCNSAEAKVENKTILNEALPSEVSESMQAMAAVMSMSDADCEDGSPEDDDSETGDYWSEDDYEVIKAYYENEEDDEDETLLVLNDQAQIMPSYARGTKSTAIPQDIIKNPKKKS
ncbi:hypothetical protein PHYBLDRAFT_64367 [Phycomyces blakesleeanus NRRL 1555(-)]|uniref:Uncharacterized protein n=1 Tax=Phycomyces blakesleeanus (strain ATCC 8743b / DSM 1359 / FGSC 10004 / NBRC 33097 / NRRL 1555) TaxID=763407 RepID=A0A167NA04_PHYB8|nr:hypothetical protein PHYBLDRAFT_64367 [Phycomyces blakesleeanus NRRL 1555(-)]OAD75450.1 hypothetical protein PHYBLDRAFT_64367 [Phycomyces blakesleeanus NRRL 1555(-)]|eukprot:XP_018293490.1 hypothetical protein PHYBLDRAFT_64367 [Phycomyces blakesleeanus NRRL 1555(-)]